MNLREQLSENAHKSWAGWTDYLFSKCEVDEKHQGCLIIPKWAVERWKRQIKTDYSDLSLSEKNSDRKEADKIISIFKYFKYRYYGLVLFGIGMFMIYIRRILCI